MDEFSIQQFIDLMNSAQPESGALQYTTPTASDNINTLTNTPSYQLAYGANNAQQDPVSRLLNSSQYQLLYGQPNTQNQANAFAAGTYDPTQAFKQDPGYQFAISEAMKAMQQNAAAKGLLESGPLQQQLQTYAQGQADQNYQRWLGQQSSLLSDRQGQEQGLLSNYQNQLAGLAQFGAGQTGGQQSVDVGNLLANILAQSNLTTGQGLATSNMNAGENIASLFANQGSLNASALMNTAAAQANNIFQGNNFAAQIQAQQQAMQNQGANSLFSGAGQQSGYRGGIF